MFWYWHIKSAACNFLKITSIHFSYNYWDVLLSCRPAWWLISRKFYQSKFWSNVLGKPFVNRSYNLLNLMLRAIYDLLVSRVEWIWHLFWHFLYKCTKMFEVWVHSDRDKILINRFAHSACFQIHPSGSLLVIPLVYYVYIDNSNTVSFKIHLMSYKMSFLHQATQLLQAEMVSLMNINLVTGYRVRWYHKVMKR